MTLFSSTLSQTAYLFTLITVGYLLAKSGILPEKSSVALSRLESWVFIPALVFDSFSENFTPERLSSAWELLLISACILLVTLPLAHLLARMLAKEGDMRRIYTYGFIFSNYGFMGNAVVGALFPEIFFEYILFCLPLYIVTYVWAMPALLIPSDSGEGGQNLLSRLKSLCNPMFVGMLLGIAVGLSGLKLPAFLASAVSSSAACMSPVAMLLTGITVSGISLKRAFTDKRAYIASFIRLAALPLAFIAAAKLLPLSETAFICALCSLAMPLGLNPIVIPSGYGKDTSAAAGMTVISHLLGCITVPLLFLLA